MKLSHCDQTLPTEVEHQIKAKPSCDMISPMSANTPVFPLNRTMGHTYDSPCKYRNISTETQDYQKYLKSAKIPAQGFKTSLVARFSSLNIPNSPFIDKKVEFVHKKVEKIKTD